MQGQEARGTELQQRLNLERFKYELLVDLVSSQQLQPAHKGEMLCLGRLPRHGCLGQRWGVYLPFRKGSQC